MVDYDYKELHWESDWNGYEVGFAEYEVVGMYKVPGFPIYCLVDTESGLILEVWLDHLD